MAVLKGVQQLYLSFAVFYISLFDILLYAKNQKRTLRSKNNSKLGIFNLKYYFINFIFNEIKSYD